MNLFLVCKFCGWSVCLTTHILPAFKHSTISSLFHCIPSVRRKYILAYSLYIFPFPVTVQFQKPSFILLLVVLSTFYLSLFQSPGSKPLRNVGKEEEEGLGEGHVWLSFYSCSVEIQYSHHQHPGKSIFRSQVTPKQRNWNNLHIFPFLPRDASV